MTTDDVQRCLDCGTSLYGDQGFESAITREDGKYCLDCVYSARIALVGCGSAKLDLKPGETVPAKELYTSGYFSLKWEFVEECCDEAKILSAKHGLLDPDEEIETYDASLDPQSESYIGDYEAGKWAVQTSMAFRVFDSFKNPYTRYVVLAGETYVKHIEDALERARHVEFPFRSDELTGIGDQQRWLRESIDSYHEPGQSGLDHYAALDGGSHT